MRTENCTCGLDGGVLEGAEGEWTTGMLGSKGGVFSRLDLEVDLECLERDLIRSFEWRRWIWFLRSETRWSLCCVCYASLFSEREREREREREVFGFSEVDWELRKEEDEEEEDEDLREMTKIRGISKTLKLLKLLGFRLKRDWRSRKWRKMKAFVKHWNVWGLGFYFYGKSWVEFGYITFGLNRSQWVFS